MAESASHVHTMRAAVGIAVAERPSGYPWPCSINAQFQFTADAGTVFRIDVELDPYLRR